MRSWWILFLCAAPLFGEAREPVDTVNLDLETAVLRFERQDLEAAEVALVSLRDEQPANAQVALYLGRVYLERGRVQDAVEQLEAATRLDPECSLCHFWLAEALVLRVEEVAFFGKLAVANRMRNAYETALELDPENLEVRVAVARYHAEAPPIAGGNMQRGLSELAEIASRDPALAEVTRALIHERLGRFEPAAHAFGLAVAVDPGSLVAWREAGLFYQRRGCWQEALQAFEEALDCAPRDPVALYEAARVSVAISEQHLRRAEAALGVYLDEPPGSGPVLFSETASPRHSRAFDALGEVYERLGRSDLAAGERTAGKLGAHLAD